MQVLTFKFLFLHSDFLNSPTKGHPDGPERKPSS